MSQKATSVSLQDKNTSRKVSVVTSLSDITKNGIVIVNPDGSSIGSSFPSTYLKLDQSIPQTIINGIPLLTGLTPTTDYQIATKKYVDDSVAVENNWDRDIPNGYLFPHTITDKVGIGTLSPNAMLDVAGGIVQEQNSDEFGIAMEGVINAVSGSGFGLFNESNIIATANGDQLNGIYNFPNFQDGGKTGVICFGINSYVNGLNTTENVGLITNVGSGDNPNGNYGIINGISSGGNTENFGLTQTLSGGNGSQNIQMSLQSNITDTGVNSAIEITNTITGAGFGGGTNRGIFIDNEANGDAISLATNKIIESFINGNDSINIGISVAITGSNILNAGTANTVFIGNITSTTNETNIFFNNTLTCGDGGQNVINQTSLICGLNGSNYGNTITFNGGDESVNQWDNIIINGNGDSLFQANNTGYGLTINGNDATNTGMNIAITGSQVSLAYTQDQTIYKGTYTGNQPATGVNISVPQAAGNYSGIFGGAEFQISNGSFIQTGTVISSTYNSYSAFVSNPFITAVAPTTWGFNLLPTLTASGNNQTLYKFYLGGSITNSSYTGCTKYLLYSTGNTGENVRFWAGGESNTSSIPGVTGGTMEIAGGGGTGIAFSHVGVVTCGDGGVTYIKGGVGGTTNHSGDFAGNGGVLYLYGGTAGNAVDTAGGNGGNVVIQGGIGGTGSVAGISGIIKLITSTSRNAVLINYSNGTDVLSAWDTVGGLFDMRYPGLAHGFAAASSTDTYIQFTDIAGTSGGALISAFSDGDNNPLEFRAAIGSTTPTAPVIKRTARKKNGTGTQAMADSEIMFQFTNNQSVKATMLGNGNLGLGITAPQTLLHVYKSTNTLPTIDAGTLAIFDNSDSGQNCYIDLFCYTPGNSGFNFGKATDEDYGYIHYIASVTGTDRINFGVATTSVMDMYSSKINSRVKIGVLESGLTPTKYYYFRSSDLTTDQDLWFPTGESPATVVTDGRPLIGYSDIAQNAYLSWNDQSVLTTSTVTFAGVNLTGFTTGSVLFAGASGAITQNNSKFFWDNSNYRLGLNAIGTPGATLEVGGNWVTNKGQLYVNAVNGASYSGTVYAINGTAIGFFYAQASDNSFQIWNNASSGGGIQFYTNGVSQALKLWITDAGNIKYMGSQIWYPSADSTAALNFTKNDASTSVFKLDTTNNRIIGNYLRLGGGTNIYSSVTGITLHANEDSDNCFFGLSNFSNTATDRVALYFVHGRGTSSSPSPAQSGDILGEIQWDGQNDTTFGNAHVYLGAQIKGLAAENFSAGHGGSHLVFYTTAIGTSSPLERARFFSGTNNNVFSIGTTTPYDLSANGLLLQASNNSSNTQIICSSFSATATHTPLFNCVKGRGTSASPTGISSGDTIGQFSWAGYASASAVYQGGYIGALAAENWSAGHGGTDMVFATTPKVTTSPTEKLRITDAGDIKYLTGRVWYPSSDNTSTLNFTKADATTTILNIDSTNGRVGVGTVTPNKAFEIYGANAQIFVNRAAATAGNYALINFASTGTQRYYMGLNADSDVNNNYFAFFEHAVSDSTPIYRIISGNFKYKSTMVFYPDVDATNAFRFFNNGLTGNPILDIDTTNGVIGIGTASPAFTLNVSGSNTYIAADRYSADAVGGAYLGRKARGTSSSPTQALVNDLLTGLYGCGYQSGGAFSAGVASMSMWAAEAFTNAAQGTYMTFEVTPTGSIVRAEKMRLTSTGLGIGMTPTYALDITGDARVSGITRTTHLKSDTSAATDMTVTCGAQKTLLLDTVVWNDLSISTVTGRLPGANTPTWAAFSANLSSYTFAINDYMDLACTEVLHDYKEGTDIGLHVHIVTNGSDVNDRKAKYIVYYSWGDTDEIMSAESSLTAELTITAGTADRTHKFLDLGDVTGTTYKIGSMLKMRIKRIAGTGTEPTADPFVEQVGVHYMIDTIGSRQELIK